MYSWFSGQFPSSAKGVIWEQVTHREQQRVIKVQEQGSQISTGTNIKERFRVSRPEWQWYNLSDGMWRDKTHLDKNILTSTKIKAMSPLVLKPSNILLKWKPFQREKEGRWWSELGKILLTWWLRTWGSEPRYSRLAVKKPNYVWGAAVKAINFMVSEANLEITQKTPDPDGPPEGGKGVVWKSSYPLSPAVRCWQLGEDLKPVSLGLPASVFSSCFDWDCPPQHKHI